MCLPSLPSRWVSLGCSITPYDCTNGGSVGVFYAWYGFNSMGSWCYSREWVWNSRTKLCCIVSEKRNVTRVSLREFDIGYISSVKTKWGETEGLIMLNVVVGSALRLVSCGNIKWFQIVAGGHRCFTIRCNRGCFETGYHFHKNLKF